MALAKCRREQRRRTRPFYRFNVNPQMSRNHPLYPSDVSLSSAGSPGIGSDNNVSTRHIVSFFPFADGRATPKTFSFLRIARYSSGERGSSPLIGYVFVLCACPLNKRHTYTLSFSRFLVGRLFVRHETALYLFIGQYFWQSRAVWNISYR